jgi:choline dehydrogenase-like flavoprotein
MDEQRIDCDVLIVGSGPGGSTTACVLAEAGREVLLLEEGADHPQDAFPAYSLEEMNQKYRNSGLTPTFGKTKITYLEGRCLGGASEINAALYHLPMPETLLDWKLRYQINAFGFRELEPFFRETEAEMHVSRIPYGLDPASLRLKAGADSMGWRSEEVQRFWSYGPDAGPNNKGTRQSMTETLIPRARRAGCQVMAGAWVERIELDGRRASSARVRLTLGDGRRRWARVYFKDLFVCAGTLQTATLLQRSGLRGLVGRNLKIHPMLRMPVRFEGPVNDPSYGVPVQQVVEFKPQMTLGCSHAALPHLVMWLGGDPAERERALASWRNMALFYVLVVGQVSGSVRNIPFFNEPFVTWPMGDADLALLGEGLHRLGRMLFKAGAVEFFNPIVGAPAIHSPRDLDQLRGGLRHGKMTVSTIHLFGSCPMGEDTRRCVVDSFGRMHGFENLYLNDASILPEATGVNPQATLMAIARRNVRHYLEA